LERIGAICALVQMVRAGLAAAEEGAVEAMGEAVEEALKLALTCLTHDILHSAMLRLVEVLLEAQDDDLLRRALSAKDIAVGIVTAQAAGEFERDSARREAVLLLLKPGEIAEEVLGTGVEGWAEAKAALLTEHEHAGIEEAPSLFSTARAEQTARARGMISAYSCEPRTPHHRNRSPSQESSEEEEDEPRARGRAATVEEPLDMSMLADLGIGDDFNFDDFLDEQDGN